VALLPGQPSSPFTFLAFSLALDFSFAWMSEEASEFSQGMDLLVGRLAASRALAGVWPSDHTLW